MSKTRVNSVHICAVCASRAGSQRLSGASGGHMWPHGSHMVVNRWLYTLPQAQCQDALGGWFHGLLLASFLAFLILLPDREKGRGGERAGSGRLAQTVQCPVLTAMTCCSRERKTLVCRDSSVHFELLTVHTGPTYTYTHIITSSALAPPPAPPPPSPALPGR